MAGKATGTIITVVIVIAVVVGVVFFLGKKKASAAPAVGGGSPATKPPTLSGLAGGYLGGLVTNALKPVDDLGVIPTSNSGLPPPACPEGVDCSSSPPYVAPPPRPAPVFGSQREAEAYSRSAF